MSKQAIATHRGPASNARAPRDWSWTIRLTHKISAIGLCGLLGVAMVGGVHLYGERAAVPPRNAAEAARTIYELTSKVEIEMLGARRAEKDFLLRNDMARAERQREISRSAMADLATLRDLLAAGGGNLSGDVDRISAALAAYQAHFETVVAQKSRLGLDEKSGLESRLRGSVHDIEALVDQLSEPALPVTMLKMRRHEKDFMLRRDGKYVEQIKARAQEFAAQVDAADIAAPAKTELKQKLADYQRDFLAWAETAQKLAGELKSMSDAFAPIEPLTESITKAVSQARAAAEQHSAALREATETRMEAALALIAIFVLVAGWLVGRSVSRPLKAMTGSMIELANGNFDVVLPGLGRRDEVGEIAQAVETFKINAAAKARDEAEAKARQDAMAAELRRADMHKLADAFESAVGEIVEVVSSASTELEASAGSLATIASRSQDLAIAVASASEEASANVQAVASASEEMASSVTEISRQVQGSSRVAGEAVEQARHTNARVGELSQAAARIGDVVELINSIAGQTNLLALNATIEAARAGEAGRGFAVVAQEVKALAAQTAKATGDISQQISGIQAATDESVTAIRAIGATIGQMSEISATIASAVEEQGAATQEISRNIQQAAQGSVEVSANIDHVRRSAGETGAASSQVLSAAKSLSSESNRLKLEVSKFLGSVRAA